MGGQVDRINPTVYRGHLVTTTHPDTHTSTHACKHAYTHTHAITGPQKGVAQIVQMSRHTLTKNNGCYFCTPAKRHIFLTVQTETGLKLRNND